MCQTAKPGKPGVHVYAQIPWNDEGYEFIGSTVCDEWGLMVSFYGGNECSSDSDCNVGFESKCDVDHTLNWGDK
jgi:hypothetical protein